jgi:thioredoxin-like negative regulator of GroEL
LEPGETVNVMPDGRVSVSGQVAVMAINGLLTKVIFDANPDHEFYVEESFPLKWMHPHLVPSGIIMKIERNPVDELTEDVIRRDHDFWSQYSERLIGNWITYDTPVSEVVDFAKRTYITRDLKDFKGDPKFVRDRNAQKAFSKLRNAIGKSIYTWRAQNASRSPEEQARYLREAEFALKQAFAFCPYSPETVFNYASLLAGMGKYDDAVAVAKTCYEFDPDNGGVRGLLEQVMQLRDARPPAAFNPQGMEEFETKFRSQPTNVDLGFQLASAYFQANRSNDAMNVLEQLLTNQTSDTRTLVSLAEAFRQVGNVEKMEEALERYAIRTPTNPEAWFDLAAVQAALGKAGAAQSNLTTALKLSDARLATEPKARNLRDLYANDARFDPVRPVLKLP